MVPGPGSTSDRRWYTHPNGDDLTICPIGLNQDHHKFRFITYNQFATRDILKMFDVGPGDEIFVPGRFVGRDGKQRNTPAVRFGNIAQMPEEPLTIDGRVQECYLVEARSIPGYSGAPVFLHFIPEHPEVEYPDWMPNKPPKSNRPKIGFKIDPFLLGIDFCHMLDREKPRLDFDDRPLEVEWHLRSNTGMMGVIPIWRVWDIVEGREMKMIRDNLAREIEQTSTAVPEPPENPPEGDCK
jgi:hypothetical protein